MSYSKLKIPTLKSKIPYENLTAFSVDGDCLEGANVPNGSILITIEGIIPITKEVIVCYSGDILASKLYAYNCADGMVARTMYANENRKNKYYKVDELLGVAIACIHNDKILWENVIDYEWRIKRDEKMSKQPPSNMGFLPFEMSEMLFR